MADVVLRRDPPAGPSAACDLAAAGPGTDTLGCVELLFFAYRDFTLEADALLDGLGLGRAHHRVLHFVHWMPGQRVIDLLETLQITKQSLARVLKALIEADLVEQQAGEADRRERLLYSTIKGAALAERLAQMQTERIEGALAAANGEADGDGHRAVQRFLEALVADPARARRLSAARLARHRPIPG